MRNNQSGQAKQETGFMTSSNSFEERFIRSSDGLTMYYRDYSAHNQGTPILCLAGLTRNSRDFEALAPQLTKKGRRVLTLDLRGRGKSDYDLNPDHYVLPVYAQDVLVFLDRLGLEKIIIIGSSLGGLIALNVAALNPSLIGAIILNDIGPVVSPEGLERIGSYVGNRGSFQTWHETATALRRVNERIYPDFDMEDWLTLARRTFRETPSGEIRADYDPAIAIPFNQGRNVDPDTDPWVPFEKLKTMPILVIRGAASDILSAETLDKMKQTKPDLKTLTLSNRGHMPLLTEPQCLEAINGFLAEIS